MFYLNRKFREEVFLTNGMQIVHEEERNNWHLAGIWKRDKFISNFFIYWLYYYYIILFFFSFTKLLLNTFTANYELSRSPGFLYFCQLRDNSYYIIFNISFIYSKTNGFYYFCWKTKNTKTTNYLVAWQCEKKHFLYCHATRYLVVQNMGSLKSAW